MNRIHILPAFIANQIAAGEVVERPASVLKELVENSIDAGATHIDIDIQQSGKQSIRVHDDGAGIAKDDLVLAVAPHATSKIRQVKDLEAIQSLGFRGEALASITAVSKCRLISSVGEEAWELSVAESGGEGDLTPAAHPRGTTVEVRELFYNTPVRRKFLRSHQTEWLKIEDLLKGLMLSHFNIAFSVKHNDQCRWNLPAALTPAQGLQRLQKLCGSAFVRGAQPVDHVAEGLQLKGWIFSDQAGWAHNEVQYFFLNQRMVRDKVLNHAIKEVMQSFLPRGRYPAYVLFLTCDPSAVDVNVHPTKFEVRFHQPRLIHDFIRVAVEPLLKPKSLNPYAIENDLPESFSYCVEEVSAPYEITASEKNHIGKFLGIFKKTYALFDQTAHLAALHLPTLYQHYLSTESLDQKIFMSRPLLLPVSLSFSAEQEKKWLNNQELFERLGFLGQKISKHQWVFRVAPQILPEENLEKCIMACLEGNEILLCFATHIASTASSADVMRVLELVHPLPESAWQYWNLR